MDAPYDGLVAIFDWDGVIIDSSLQHERSWELVAETEGLSLPTGHFARSFGKRNREVIPEVLGWARDPVEIERLSALKEAFYLELVSQDGTRPLPGVRPWLERLGEARVPCAVGTSAPRNNILTILSLADLTPFFRIVVAAEDVSRGKPDPEVFQTAAARLGASASRAIVFEDAPIGVAAARAAGMKVVAVAGTHPRETFPDADLVVDRLDELTVQRVAEIVGNP